MSAQVFFSTDQPRMSFWGRKPKNLFFREILRSAAQKQNAQPALHPWIPAFAGMTKTTRPSFRASSARPGIQEPLFLPSRLARRAMGDSGWQCYKRFYLAAVRADPLLSVSSS